MFDWPSTQVEKPVYGYYNYNFVSKLLIRTLVNLKLQALPGFVESEPGFLSATKSAAL